MQSLSAALLSAAERLAKGPHPERARQDAGMLLRAVLGKDQAWLMTHGDESLTEANAAEFAPLLERRFKGEPVQYILGEAEFYGLTFRVTPDVLIPRPETEHLVEAVLEAVRQAVSQPLSQPVLGLAEQWQTPRIADVGTGSGAIAIALAHQLPAALITAIDLSPAALALARENAARHSASIRLMVGDLLTSLVELDVVTLGTALDPALDLVQQQQFEMIVSNPPYIPIPDRASLPIEVREYEPEIALFAGQDGLEIYRRLIPSAYCALVCGGWLMMEIGFGQASAVQALMTEAGFEQIKILPDLRAIPRVACGQRPYPSQQTTAGMGSSPVSPPSI